MYGGPYLVKDGREQLDLGASSHVTVDDERQKVPVYASVNRQGGKSSATGLIATSVPEFTDTKFSCREITPGDQRTVDCMDPVWIHQTQRVQQGRRRLTVSSVQRCAQSAAAYIVV